MYSTMRMERSSRNGKRQGAVSADCGTQRRICIISTITTTVQIVDVVLWNRNPRKTEAESQKRNEGRCKEWMIKHLFAIFAKRLRQSRITDYFFDSGTGAKLFTEQTQAAKSDMQTYALLAWSGCMVMCLGKKRGRSKCGIQTQRSYTK